ncbi:MAG: hypothetical protein ACREGJ_04250 [Candidatus Saccharimonadales bacterium]
MHELKKLSFEFFYALAKGKEPLTYTAEDDGGRTHQVEVFADSFDENEISLVFGFDTEFGGRFDRSKGKLFEHKLDSEGRWTN